ncbi:MAG: hypothetical protein V3U10_02905 [Bacteroidota bacterium]
MSDEGPLCKNDVGVLDWTKVRLTIPDVYNDIVIPRKGEDVIAFAVGADLTLCVLVRERRYDSTAFGKLQVVREVLHPPGMIAPRHETMLAKYFFQIDVEAVAQQKVGDSSLCTKIHEG